MGAPRSRSAAGSPSSGVLGRASGRAWGEPGAITVSAFWPRATSAAAFRDLKTRFRAYEKGGIVGIRGLQQAGAYVFAFRKGVVGDPRLADRAAVERPAAPPEAEAPGQAPRRPPPPRGLNQYAWLTDASVSARWAAAFPGRAVRIYHRATDLRVEVIGADSLAEFEMIRRYVFTFLDGLLKGPGRLRTGDLMGRARLPGAAPAEPEETRVASRRLRRLQERDPNLFDLKKYDPAATGYSILCQSGRQPHVYNETETRELSAKRRAALVRYWNFTDEEPAFYECPNPRFPHLSFRSGQHPLGFCLPCCKKTRAAVGSRAALVNEQCLERGPGRGRGPAPPEAQEPGPRAPEPMSRHVLTYGKEVPVGRISDAPREISTGLLLGALPPPFGLYLVGVEQAVPAVPEAGFAYALAYAAGLGEMTADEVIASLAELAASMGDTFYALGGGGGGVFASAADLADAILGAFVRRDGDLSPLGPGGVAADLWPPILADLARHAFGVETVVASDPDGSGSVTLEASPDAVAAITGQGVCSGYVKPRIALLVRGPMGTLPAAALNPKLYLRAISSLRWMSARRTFGDDAGEALRGEGSDVIVTDRVASAIRDALASAVPPSLGAHDLAAVGQFVCASGGRYTVEERLIDMHNLCYAVRLRGAGGAPIYFPVRRSAYPVDGTPCRYGSRPESALPRDALLAAVGDFNQFLGTADIPFTPVTLASLLVNPKDEVVGFIHLARDTPLYFYHDAVPATTAEAGPAGPKATRTLLPYDPRIIDEAILGAARGREPDSAEGGPPEKASRAAARARAQNSLYRLFLAEFSATLRDDRNRALRREIEAAIRGTRFEAPKSVSALRRWLAEILRGYPADLAAVREAVARAYTQSPRDPAGAALAAIEATAFAFDRQRLAKLQGLGSRPAVAAALRELLGPRVEVSPPGVWGPPPGNLYVACGDARGHAAAAAHCARQKLVVPADRIDDFYDILAADILNPGKTGLLSAVSAGVFDPLDFIRRPGEHLALAVSAQ